MYEKNTILSYSQVPFHVSQDGHQHKKESQKLNQNTEVGDPKL